MTRFAAYVRRNHFALIAVVLALAGTSVAALAAIPSPNGVIHACYKKKTGNLRVVSAGKRCSSSEKALAFNQRGPQGLRGATGGTGAAGANGQNGQNGQDGAAGTARAYAHVIPGTSPLFDATKTKGFTAVMHAGTGVYCLTPAAGIDPAHFPAVTSAETGDSANAQPFLAETRNSGADCSAGQYEVITFGHGGPSPADDVAFNVIVP